MPEAPRFSRRRIVLYSLIVVLGFFGISEGVLRVVGVPEPARPRILLRSMDMDVSFPFMRPDPDLFWSLRPSFQGEFQRSRVSINSLGLRGPEIDLPKPPGRRRVVCFGDSITFGFGLADDASYPACLGRLLAARGVDVVNAGVTGYTSHQVLGLLRRIAPSIQADVATFCVGWNDGNQRAVNDREYAGRLRTEMAIEDALRHVYLYRAVKGAYLRVQAREVRRSGTSATKAVRGGDPTGRGARVPIAQYRENLAAIVAECRARGIRPAFVALPMRRRAGDAAFESPYPKALADAARDLGVPVLDIGALGLGGTGTTEDLFIDAIHFSPEGSQQMAREIVRQLEASGLL